MENELNIRYSKLKFILKFNKDFILPEFKTSAIRGGIGQMLLKNYCIRDENCESCDFQSECIVQRILYSQFDKKPDYVTTGESVGYVLCCTDEKIEVKKGDRLSFELVLFGNTCLYIPVLIQAVLQLGEMGIGKNQAKYYLDSVINDSGQHLWNGKSILKENIEISTLYGYLTNRKAELKIRTEKVQIDFITPLTLKYQSQFIRKFDINAIIRAVQRRINILDFYEHIDGENAYKKRLYSSCIKSQSVHRAGIKRYSTRKEQAMWLNGIEGTLILENVPDEVLDLLIIGELIHIGKNTSFGFGKYIIQEETKLL